MHLLKITLISLFIGFAISATAQETKLLSKVPETKEEFVASEPNVIASVEWLENTPINENEEMHKFQYGLLIEWMTNSPTVTLSLQPYVMEYTKKNSELLIIFMSGWTKYSLQNEYTKDALQCNLAGLQSMIKVYKTGKLKKDKKMDELVDLDEKGKLESWLKGQIKE
ncbi:hypothetical protein D3C71_772510 [compost metagenome]